MDIKKLDCDVISKIRSSFSINSVAQCVFELVCNSLDANSTSVAVRLNLVTFKIQVADNGDGITKENMERLGLRYMTNKCGKLADLQKNLKTYGFRGEAIANIVDMCKSISITSRFKTCSETYSKVLSKECKGELKLSKDRASVGTTITVLGWLSSVPVRQRMIVPDTELEEVKKQLESLVIINPRASFTLRNDITGLLILNCCKSPDIVDSFRQLHPEIKDSFTLVKVSKKKVSIEMLIQKELLLTKKFQYIYVNKRPIRSAKIRKHILKAFALKNTKSLLYNTKRYPVYVMNIKCPQSCVDNLLKPSKMDVEFTCWGLILDCIDKITKTFLGSADESNKEQIPVPTKRQGLGGISQLFGAIQASAFKRKSNDNQSDDSDRNSNNKLRRLDDKASPPNSIVRHNKGFAKDKTTVKPSQMSENYAIDASDKPLKALKVKPALAKEPLAINAKRTMLETDLVAAVKNVISSEADAAEVGSDKKQLKPFDQRSVYSRLNTNEDRGKDLIMEMFLKSTQVFKGETEDFCEPTYVDVSKETIEEADFLFENHVQDKAKGVNTTMSVSVIVKKRRLKNIDNRKITNDKSLVPEVVENTRREDFFHRHNLYRSHREATAAVGLRNAQGNHCRAEFDGVGDNNFQKRFPPHQGHIDGKHLPARNSEIVVNQQRLAEFHKITTASQHVGTAASRFHPPYYEQYFNRNLPKIEPNTFKNLPSKCVQVSQNFIGGLPRQKSYQTDLATKLDGFTLGSDNMEDVKNDYTILINTVHKKKKYVFVKKSEEEMDVDGSPEIMGFKPLKICQYDPEESENMFKFQNKESFGGVLSLRRNIRDDRELEDKEFRKPALNCVPKSTRLLKAKKNDINNVHFRGMTTHPPPIKLQTKPLCSQSPYFVKNRRNSAVNYVSRPPAFEKCQPIMFKSAQICKDNAQQISKGDYCPPQSTHYYKIDGNQENPNFNTQPCCAGFVRPKCCCCNPYQMSPTDYHAARKMDFHHSEENHNRKCLHIDVNDMQPLIHEPKIVAYPQGERYLNNMCKNMGIRHQELRQSRAIVLPSCYDVHRRKQRNPMILNCQEKNVNFLNAINDKCPAVTEAPMNDDISYRNNTKPLMDQKSRSTEKHDHQLEPPPPHCHQAMDISDPLWLTPIVSGKNDVEPSVIEKNANANNKEDPQEASGKLFNFKSSCSPNIFTDEVADDVQNNNPKLNNEINWQGLNTLCDLEDLGLVDSKKKFSSKQSSRLEISIPSHKARRTIVEKELLQQNNNRDNNNYCFSAEYVDDTNKTAERPDERSRIIIDSQNEWIRQIGDDNKTFFVNKRTGMVTAKTPTLIQNKFDFDERLDFVPKGMSPVLKEHQKVEKSLSQNAKGKLQELILEGYHDDELMVVKWQNFVGDDPKRFFEEIYREKSKQFETCIPTIQDNNNTFKMPKTFMSFTNEVFRNIEIIGQVDKKFIAAREKSENVLILFDQHAVHERIRVEAFLREYKGLKTPCKEKLTIFMPQVDLCLIKKHSAFVQSLGLSFEFFSNGLHLTEMPLCVNSEVNCEDLNKLLNVLIKEIVDLLRVTRGSTSILMPKIIQNIINLKACRGAVKFGDALSMSDCIELLKDLSKCNLPFQCAHGRPTLAPILSLNKVQSRSKIQVKKIDFKKLLTLPRDVRL